MTKPSKKARKGIPRRSDRKTIRPTRSPDTTITKINTGPVGQPPTTPHNETLKNANGGLRAQRESARKAIANRFRINHKIGNENQDPQQRYAKKPTAPASNSKNQLSSRKRKAPTAVDTSTNSPQTEQKPDSPASEFERLDQEFAQKTPTFDALISLEHFQIIHILALPDELQAPVIAQLIADRDFQHPTQRQEPSQEPDFATSNEASLTVPYHWKNAYKTHDQYGRPVKAYEGLRSDNLVDATEKARDMLEDSDRTPKSNSHGIGQSNSLLWKQAAQYPRIDIVHQNFIEQSTLPAVPMEVDPARTDHALGGPQ